MTGQSLLTLFSNHTDSESAVHEMQVFLKYWHFYELAKKMAQDDHQPFHEFCSKGLLSDVTPLSPMDDVRAFAMSVTRITIKIITFFIAKVVITYFITHACLNWTVSV